MAETDVGAEMRDDLPERADVVVVGGGIAGASTAYQLAQDGVDVLVLERDEVGRGATAAAVGVLSPPLRQPFHETVHHRGEEAARRIWTFAQDSIRSLAEALRELGAEEEAGLDLSGGTVLAESHSDHQVRRSFEALEESGFPVTWLTSEEMKERCGGRGFTGGYRLEGGGALSPGPTTLALMRGAEAAGATVREGVGVREVEPRHGGLVCDTSRGPVSCEMVVYATHVDSRRFSNLLGDEIVPIRGQGLAARAPEGFDCPGCFATHWKLNVWRRGPDGTLWMGGWRHDAWDRAYWKTKPEVDSHLQGDIQRWFEEAFPGLAPLEVQRRWSGIFGWTADYLPMVGPLPGTTKELVVSGFSGGGLPFAFGSGRIIARAVTGKEPLEGTALFNPRRFT